MFGLTNPFGQSSNSPFGSPSVFGQNNNANNNPFAPKPFDSPTPFGLQTGDSLFGGTLTGVFGAAQSSSPFSSTTTFGASSSLAFGSTVPAFGASSTPAFGGSSSSFDGSSVFGQKASFGGFGSTSTPASPLGSTNQQSQPAFGSSIFGSSSPFGATSQSAFGASSTPAFGATSTPAFGATSTPAFGATSTPAFGATSAPAFSAMSAPAFGATPALGATSAPAFGTTASPAFGSTGTTFGVSNTPVSGSGGAFGASSNPLFGSSSTPMFGTSNTPAFGTSSSPAYGTSSTPAFGISSTPVIKHSWSSPAFGQSASAFGSTPFGTTTTPFGAQSSPFGAQSTTPAFGSTGFGQTPFGTQRGGSRVAPYTPTTEADSGTQPAGKLESISAMPVYKDKSHEELRWEDYQLGDKGGPLPATQPAGGIFGSAGAFGASSSPLFGSSSTPMFGTSSTPAFGTSSTPAFGTSSTPAFGTSSTPVIKHSWSSPAFGQSASAFGSTPFGTTATPFGAQSSPFGVQSTTPAFGSTGFGQTPFGTYHGGSRVAPYTPTNEADGCTQPADELESISAMPVYKDKSHEELRWEDYQLRDKGGLLPATQPAGGIFGSGGAFGASGSPLFGSSSTPMFGTSSTPMFGTSSTPAFGTSSSPAFGTSSTPAFGTSSTPVIKHSRSSPAFGQSASAFGSTPFGTTTTPFGAQSSPFGAQSTTPAFGSTGFGQIPFGTQHGGSRVAPYMPTTEADSVTQTAGELESTSAMPVYKDKSHEELRWEDYQLGDKGGPLPATQPAGGMGFSSTASNLNILGSSTAFGQSSASPFSASMPSNPFTPKTPSIGGLNFGSSTTPTFSSSPFSASTSSGLFGSTSLPTSSTFVVGSSPSLFGSSTPFFSSGPSQATNTAFGSNTQSSPLFQSTAPLIGQTGSAFGETTTSFGQGMSSPFGQGMLGASTPGFGVNTFSSTPSLINSSNTLGFGQSNNESRLGFLFRAGVTTRVGKKTNLQMGYLNKISLNKSKGYPIARIPVLTDPATSSTAVQTAGSQVVGFTLQQLEVVVERVVGHVVGEAEAHINKKMAEVESLVKSIQEDLNLIPK